MKITAMKITPWHKLFQQVKHPATTWPNLIPPFSPRGQRLWSTSISFKCVSFPSYATSRDKEKRMKTQTCWTNGPRPNLCCFFFLFPLTPPRGTRLTLPTQRPIGPRPIFPFSLYATSWHTAEVPDILPNRYPIDFSFYIHHLVVHFVSLFSFFFFTPPRGTEQKSPTHCSKRSPTDLCFLFVSFSYTTSWHIFLSFFFCFSPPRSTEQKFSTHC